MSVNTPVSVWAPYNQRGEFSASGDDALATEAGVDITTEASVTIIEQESTFTVLPTTTWVENEGV